MYCNALNLNSSSHVKTQADSFYSKEKFILTALVVATLIGALFGILGLLNFFGTMGSVGYIVSLTVGGVGILTGLSALCLLVVTTCCLCKAKPAKEKVEKEDDEQNATEPSEEKCKKLHDKKALLEVFFNNKDLHDILQMTINQLDNSTLKGSAEFIVDQYEGYLRVNEDADFQLAKEEKEELLRTVTQHLKSKKPPISIKKGKVKELPDGSKLHVFSTVGDGSCGLHALLGNSVNGASYQTDAKKARKDFCSWLRELHRKNQLPTQIDNVLYDYFLKFHLAPSGFKTDEVRERHANYYHQYNDLSYKEQDNRKESFVKDEVVFEAYLNNLKKTHVYLLQDELIAAAFCFNKKLLLCQPGWYEGKRVIGMKTLNDTEKDEVAVWYNGYNHYERAKITP